MSAAGWVDAFLEMMAVERASARNTLTAYGKDLEDARGFLSRTGETLDTAPAESIEAYFQDLGARGLSPATAARRRSAVRQFYRFVLGEGWRGDDPSRRVVAPKAGRPLPKVLSRDEVDRLIAAAAKKDGGQGLRLACMIELLYASGLRISELLALPLSAVARDPAYRDRQGQGRQGAAGPAERRRPHGGDGLSGRRPAFNFCQRESPSKKGGTARGCFPSRGCVRPADRAPRFGQLLEDAAIAAGIDRAEGQPARPAPRLRDPPAGGRRRLKGDPDPAGPR
jgi:integrase/recombinase XerD